MKGDLWSIQLRGCWDERLSILPYTPRGVLSACQALPRPLATMMQCLLPAALCPREEAEFDLDNKNNRFSWIHLVCICLSFQKLLLSRSHSSFVCIMRPIGKKNGFVVLTFFWSQKHLSLKWTEIVCPCFFLAYTGLKLFYFISVQPIPQCIGSQCSHNSKHTGHSAPAAENIRGLFHIPKSCQTEDSRLSWITSTHKN